MNVLDNTIERIKNAGFSHIKVEFEADMGRLCDSDCWSCAGSGNQECSSCDGEGFYDTGNTTRLSGDTVYAECDDCYGEGTSNCYDCDGSGDGGGEYADEDTCHNYMVNYVGQEVASRLTYGRFYEDGSVDSEFTFTLPIEHVADVKLWSEAFVALSNECGNLDVDGAGLHIAVLPKESNGRYPVESGTMPANKVRNFTSEMTKLLPALFFLASSGVQSRGLNYRNPQISSEKYSAISHHDRSCFEFRVFETCYDRPDAFFEYLETIANSLEFYANPELKVDAIGKQFGFSEGNHLVSRFYSTPEQLRILNSTVKHLKPKNKTLKELKKDRGMDFTIKELQRRNKEELRKLHSEYYEYKERWLENFHRPLDEYEKQLVQQYTTEHGYNEVDAIANVRRSSRLQSIQDFISNNTRNRNYISVQV